MRKPHRALVISAGITALALGLTVTAARAASAGPSPTPSPTLNPSPSPTPSPTPSGAASWSVSSANNTFDEPNNVGPAVLTDSSTGAKISCQSVVVVLQAPGGMGLHHTLVAWKSVSIGDCTLPDGTPVTVTPGRLPWTLTGERFDPSRNLGVTTGGVHHVGLSLSSSSCSGAIDGTAAGANDGVMTYQFYNNPHWFIVRTWGSNLHAYNINGCSGIFNNGDKVTLHVALAALFLVITSP